MDGLGSTRALTDKAGNVTDTYDYEAFGELVDLSGESENDYLFAGEQFDGGLGQYYLRQRYYEQGVGRFTRRDTYEGLQGQPISLHKYLYANADPVNGIDPSGYVTLTEIAAARHIRNTLAEIQLDSYSHLIGATIQQGDYDTKDVIVGIAIGLSVTAAQLLLPKMVKGGLKLGKFVFDNLLPAQLADELVEAASLGVTSFKVGNAQFSAAVDSGELIKWVITQEGELLMVPKYVDGVEISHAVINQGKPVVAAGEAMIAGDTANGFYLLQISNHSGHYQPNFLSIKLGKAAFELEGVNVLGAVEDIVDS